MQADRLVIISGTSGSGKSTVLDAFEDMGFFCVENLPAPLFTGFAEYLLNLPGRNAGLSLVSDDSESEDFALLLDCRRGDRFSYLPSAITRLEQAGIAVEVLFCDCDDDVILRRYRETRRPHPLLVNDDSGVTLKEALVRERELLAEVRSLAKRVIDTSTFTPHELRRAIEEYVGVEERHLQVSVLSFGFKYGVPQDIDLLIDVRYLPNPHFVPGLKEQTGAEAEVRDYVFGNGEAEELVTRYSELVQHLLPRYEQEGKRYLTIGIGCTGGRHRSVAVSRELAAEIAATGRVVHIVDRDLSR